MARHRIRLLVGFASLVLCSVTGPGEAGNTPCDALPQQAQRIETQACNPRQECLDKIPSSVWGPARDAAVATCNALPTADKCPRTVTFNPRQECLDKLPKITISSVDGGGAGGNRVYANRDEVFFVHGPNVGMPGNTVRKFDEQVWSLAIVPRPNCLAPDCVALSVRTGEIGGTWRFVLSAAHGNSEATGSFTSVLAPATAGPKSKLPPLPLPKPDLYFSSVVHDVWGERVEVQISNKGGAPSPPALVYMQLYRVDEKGGRTALTSDHKDIIPLCPVPADKSSSMCPAWWDTEFHVPVTSFAQEIVLDIDPVGSVNESDRTNNSQKLSVPGQKR